MDNWNWILLLGGIAIGAVVVYLFLKPTQATATSLSPVNMYRAVAENEESWTVKRDNKGRAIGVTVHRSVKSNE